MNFYLEADEKEVAFYKHFKVKPKMMSSCSFHNLNKHGIEIGSDVCERADDENSTCKGCEGEIDNIECYPPITSVELLLIILICGTEGHSTSLYYCTELIDKILNYAIIMSLNEDVYNKIQEVLQNHVEEIYKG